MSNKLFKNIEYKAELTTREDSDFTSAVHWKITLGNNKPFTYSVGIGNYIQLWGIKNRIIARTLENEFLDIVKNRALNNPKALKNLCISTGGGLLEREKQALKDAMRKSNYINLVSDGIQLRFELLPPKIEDVIYGLHLDSMALEEPFSAWCGNLGYDDDSMKARSVYDACQENGFIYKSLPINHEKAQEFFQDY